MSENKTQQTDANVTKFLDSIPNETKRNDSYTLVELMEQASGESPKMWGSSIIGFGKYHYVYESGREGDAPIIGFSPRKQNLALYLLDDWQDFDDLRSALGKHSLGKSCLYINKLADVNMPALKQLIKTSLKHNRSKIKNNETRTRGH